VKIWTSYQLTEPGAQVESPAVILAQLLDGSIGAVIGAAGTGAIQI
jgi:hypothetical protein